MRPLVLLLLLSGCAGQTTEQVVLNPAPNTCQATEVRASAFSTAVMGACWNERGEMVNAQWIEGQAVVSVPLAIMGAGATLGSAAILGSKIVKAAKSIPTQFGVDQRISGTVDGNIDVSGAITVDGMIDIGDGTITIDQNILPDDLLDNSSIQDPVEEWLEGVGD